MNIDLPSVAPFGYLTRVSGMIGSPKVATTGIQSTAPGCYAGLQSAARRWDAKAQGSILRTNDPTVEVKVVHDELENHHFS